LKGDRNQEQKLWNLQERMKKYSGYRGMHVSTFANRQVVEFVTEVGISDFLGRAYAIRWEYGNQENTTLTLLKLLEDSLASQLEALVIGTWDGEGDRSSSAVIDGLVAAKDQLTNLKALFIGDIHYHENEISSIVQSDVSPIFKAYPNLEILQIRGGDSLAFSQVRHEHLQGLIVETGGLNPETIAQICALNLPALSHLELWLGSEDCGGNSTIADLNPILVDKVFPNLIYLGLRNSQYSDDIAKAVVQSPLINTIRILDLSMGTLTDDAVQKLLKNSAVKQLDILNISENYVTDPMVALLMLQQAKGTFPVRIMTDGQKDVEGDRYCSVAE
jgi:hypothetical protein